MISSVQKGRMSQTGKQTTENLMETQKGFPDLGTQELASFVTWLKKEKH